MRCWRIGKWSRKIEREQMSDVSHNAKSSSSLRGVSIWMSGWSRSIRQVQASDGEGKRFFIDRLNRVDTQEIFTDAADLT